MLVIRNKNIRILTVTEEYTLPKYLVNKNRACEGLTGAETVYFDGERQAIFARKTVIRFLSGCVFVYKFDFTG